MSKQTIQDEICYCAQCGISFVWTQEEQHVAAQQAVAPRAGAPPTRCPGCRLLVPAAGRERGLVKWYDRRRQYGFIVRHGQPDIYVHRSGLGDGALPQPGDLVEFVVAPSDRGPTATEVAILHPSTSAKP